MLREGITAPVAVITAASLAAITWRWYLQRSRRIRGARHITWVQNVGFTGFTAEILVAVQLALQCGEAVRAATEVQSKLKDSSGDCAGIDPVTATDEANEALVTKTLSQTFPDHQIIGEEASAALGCVPSVPTDTPTWIVDPIDGTQNFVHGVPLSVVSIGLCIDGEPKLGVIYDPYLDELFVGLVGQGAYLNGERLRGDACRALQQAMVLTDPGYERSAVGAEAISRAICALLQANTYALRIIGSSVQALCWVACGRASAFYIGFGNRDCPKPWDWCAAHAIGKASGIVFRRLDSDAPFDITSKSCIVTSTPELADELEKILKAQR